MRSGSANTEATKQAAAGHLLAPHFRKGDMPAFATFRTEGGYELSPAARDRVLTRCLEEHGKRYGLFAAVVMADHLHLVLQALYAERGWPFDLNSVLAALKDGTAQAVRKVIRGNTPVWQAETFTVELRSQDVLDEKCEFVRQNPVRWGVVKTPEDYLWLWLNPRL